jgi:hypothetical protein
MFANIILGLQLVAMVSIGLLFVRALSKVDMRLMLLTEVIDRNTRVAFATADTTETVDAAVRDLHEARFGPGGPLPPPTLPRRRPQSDSGFRPSARSASNPDPDEIEPTPGRYSKRGEKL